MLKSLLFILSAFAIFTSVNAQNGNIQGTISGFVYYSDEGVCIRKYVAEPDAGNEQISCFGGAYFSEDIEGIAIASYPDVKGYLIVSNQQLGEFNIFSRETNAFVKALNLSTTETDG